MQSSLVSPCETVAGNERSVTRISRRASFFDELVLCVLPVLRDFVVKLRRRLEEHLFPTIDVYRLAGDEGRAGTAEKADGRGNFLRLAVSPERDPALGALARWALSCPCRVYASGRHAVHAYFILGHLQSKRTRHPRQSVLGGGTVHLADQSGQRAVAAKRDYASAPVLNHRRETRLDTVKRAVERDGHDFAPRLEAHVDEWDLSANRRVQYQDVDAPEAPEHAFHHRLHGARVGDVGEKHV